MSGRIYGVCSFCHKNRATQRHHKFPQSKPNRKLYGALLDDPRNAVPACADCNGSHANVIIWSEIEFCRALGIETRSKSAHAQEMREREYNARKRKTNE
jgi:hypothetical protein